MLILIPSPAAAIGSSDNGQRRGKGDCDGYGRRRESGDCDAGKLNSLQLAVSVVNPGDTLTISGNISGNPAGGIEGLTMSGAGTLLLSGANSYSGGTTVSPGTLAIAAPRGASVGAQQRFE